MPGGRNRLKKVKNPRPAIQPVRLKRHPSQKKSQSRQRIPQKSPIKMVLRASVKIITCLVVVTIGVFGQSRHSVKGGDSADSIISVTANRTDKKTDPIKVDNLFLYENGIEQKIKNFSFDPSPARIVILVDNSQTISPDLEQLKAVTQEFAYEIFEGDQLYVIAYDEKPEIIQEWTDDAKKLETSLATFRKKGNPYLFDALSATVSDVLVPLMPGTPK